MQNIFYKLMFPHHNYCILNNLIGLQNPSGHLQNQYLIFFFRFILNLERYIDKPGIYTIKLNVILINEIGLNVIHLSMDKIEYYSSCD